MNKYSLKFHPLLNQDIQQIISYYNTRSEGLGRRFYEELKSHYQSLMINPFFQVRYKNISCLPLLNFPYMIHFYVDEAAQIVFIEGVFSTDENPDKNWGKR